MSLNIVKPKIKYLEERDWVTDDYEDLLYGAKINQSPTRPIALSHQTIDSCQFIDVDCQPITFDHVAMLDVIFDHCDLSNRHFDDVLLGRVIFRNCKMVGTTLRIQACRMFALNIV